MLQYKNCLYSRSLTKSVAQSTPVATTSLLPSLKVACTNGGARLCQVYQSTRRRRSNHGQWNCVAGRCVVLPRFSEHWRRRHSSDLRQRRTARAIYVRVVWCTRTQLCGWCLRYFISDLRSSSSTPITRFQFLVPRFPTLQFWPSRVFQSCVFSPYAAVERHGRTYDWQVTGWTPAV